MTAQRPEWTLDEDGAQQRVRLAGSWLLFTRSEDRERLARELTQLPRPQTLFWDLRGIERLDSAGALFLWRLWGRQWPRELDCPADYRHWFERFDALPARSSAPGYSLGRALDRLGADLIALWRHVAGLSALLAAVLADFLLCLTRPRLMPWREITASIYRAGVSSLVLIGATGFVIGVVMALQLGVILSKFGANERIIALMGTAVLRELGPVISGLIQSGRAGSAITAGIGGMHLTQELDALRTFGGSPTLRLVLPRVIAMLLVMPLLVIWADFTEILGGMVAAQLDMGVPHTLFISRFPETASLLDFWVGLAKGAVFGLCIAIVACYFGLVAEASTESLSRNTTKAVVVSLTLILVLDAASGALLAKLGVFG